MVVWAKGDSGTNVQHQVLSLPKRILRSDDLDISSELDINQEEQD